MCVQESIERKEGVPIIAPGVTSIAEVAQVVIRVEVIATTLAFCFRKTKLEE